MAGELPSTARAVIVGGGIVGCSVAYHLTKRGWNDVLLVEQNQLTSGTTWHAAGLVGQLRASRNLTRLAVYATDLYARLEDETGQATGFKQPGGLMLAQTAERMTELKRGASMAASFGVAAEVISPAEVGERYPLARTDDLEGALWLPGDGQTNPTDTTMALAKGARQGGARIAEGVRVLRLLSRGKAIAGIEAVAGGETVRIDADAVVLAAGMWSRTLGESVGVPIPLHAAEHMYIVTEPMHGATPDLPVLRDFDACIYAKEDAGKLLIGGFEPVAKPWGMGGLPHDSPFHEIGEDWDQFEVLMEGALNRVPALESVGIRQFLNGPESFTPDTAYYLGEAPGLRGLFVAAGFNSVGIASAAGAGKALADWVVEGEAPMDLADIDIRRAEPFQNTAGYLFDRTVEALGRLYAMHWPYDQPRTARNARLTPFHDRLAARGAWFGVVAGWERPLWYAVDGVQSPHVPGYGAQDWWPQAEREASAAREGVAVFDQTPFGKFLLAGPDAEAVLQRLCANDVAVPEGRVVYTQMLNPRGGIEADLTVTRLAEDRFWIVAGSATRIRDRDWIERHIPDDARCMLSDETSAWAALGVMGPGSRELLATLTDADLSAEAFPFASAAEIEMGYAPVRALRQSYVGELGWELYIPTEFALPIYERLVDASESHDLVHAGLQAQDSLRLEKGFKHWGHDIGPEDTPLEAGLGFAIAFDKNTPFIGRDALLKQQTDGLHRRLVLFTVEDGVPLLLHEEPVWRDGRRVGATTSGNRGFTVGKPVCMGYVESDGAAIDRDFIESGRFEIEVAGERFPARPHLAPLWDPKGVRMRA
ncbi:MAG: FAD-dependent oxidoreductase [Alphaproteobacteria bacterium]|nr:FAD-dependent oxidoreductase [Alphaproteobacteria bacterium]